MLSSIKKDRNRRDLVKKFEIKRLQVKVFSQDLSLKSVLSSLNSRTNSSSNRFDEPFKSRLDNGVQSMPLSTKGSLHFLLYQKGKKATPRNSSKDRITNRCIETGRARAVLRFCKLSRMILRDKASKGVVPGTMKASW